MARRNSSATLPELATELKHHGELAHGDLRHGSQRLLRALVRAGLPRESLLVAAALCGELDRPRYLDVEDAPANTVERRQTIAAEKRVH